MSFDTPAAWILNTLRQKSDRILESNIVSKKDKAKAYGLIIVEGFLGGAALTGMIAGTVSVVKGVKTLVTK